MMARIQRCNPDDVDEDFKDGHYITVWIDQKVINGIVIKILIF